MNSFFRGIIAAYGAKKLGGGCFSTIVIFILIYVLLGQCNQTSHGATRPASVKVQVKIQDDKNKLSELKCND